jgi:hypothetical protein
MRSLSSSTFPTTIFSGIPSPVVPLPVATLNSGLSSSNPSTMKNPLPLLRKGARLRLFRDKASNIGS